MTRGRAAKGVRGPDFLVAERAERSDGESSHSRNVLSEASAASATQNLSFHTDS